MSAMTGRCDASASLKPFTLSTPEWVLADLDRRLVATRWPSLAPGTSWRWGTDPTFLQSLVTHWRERFDWRDWEARLNAYPQYIATVSGVKVHVLVEQGSGARPLPIILSHGWPGSVFELLALVEPLAHPERFGGSAGDGFTVVLPSLPGFGFSPAPDRILAPADVAQLWKSLMIEHLGFDRYVAHGGDTGAAITSWLGLEQDDSLPAIHLNTPVLQADWSLERQPLHTDEKEFLEQQRARLDGEDAYQHIHAEKPATLAFGLRDSPVGLAAWMVEKYHGWTDPGALGLPGIGLDALIANIMAYWVGTFEPVHWMYQALRGFVGYRLPPGRRVETPTGFCLFPNDIVVPPPRRWLERAYNVAAVTRAPSGGHFPGLDNRDLLVADIRQFFRPYRENLP
jgi:pimeloyl-ACP methyl ester carboxylesterase